MGNQVDAPGLGALLFSALKAAIGDGRTGHFVLND